MPRIRTIKPELPHDAKLASVSRDARYTFILLLTVADDAGYFRANLKYLVGALYPHDTDVNETRLRDWIRELLAIGVVSPAEMRDGTPVAHLVNWKKHQKIDRPSRSHIKEALASHSRGPREGPSEGVLSPESLVLSPDLKSKSKTTVASQPADAGQEAHPEPTPKRTDTKSFIGTVMTAVRQWAYAPDGKPPDGWDEGRDVHIAHQLEKYQSAEDICMAIEGVRLIVDAPKFYDGLELGWCPPKTKFTLRVLYHTRTGVRDLFQHAHDVWWVHYNTIGRGRRRTERLQATPIGETVELLKRRQL